MNRRLLFLCSQNKLRSPTAETVFSDYAGVEVDSAGLNNDAVVPLSVEQIEWADLILVMETAHRIRLNRKFKHALGGKRIVVLNIPDNYDYMEPALVDLLKSRCAPYLPESPPRQCGGDCQGRGIYQEMSGFHRKGPKVAEKRKGIFPDFEEGTTKGTRKATAELRASHRHRRS